MRFLTLIISTLLLASSGAYAATPADELVDRLAEYVPADDVAEYLAAADTGELYWLESVEIREHSTRIAPEEAKELLGITTGAPFVLELFVERAQELHAAGRFSYIEWLAEDLGAGEVALTLWYRCYTTTSLRPEVNYENNGGVYAGLRYLDTEFRGGDEQLTASVQINENVPEETNFSFSWTDNALNGGDNSFGFSASGYSDWRTRRGDTIYGAETRDRVSRASVRYAWHALGKPFDRGTLALDAGGYRQDHFTIIGDPNRGGGQPRMDIPADGTAYFTRLSYSEYHADRRGLPQDGYYIYGGVEQHFGDFEFTRAQADARRYFAMDNLFGIDPQEPAFGERQRLDKTYPTASLAIQLQADIAEGDVPFSEELRVGSSRLVRGFRYDNWVGTTAIAGRIEYRWDINPSRKLTGFIFSDHAGMGEDWDGLEAFHSYGGGLLLTLPFMGGIRAGGYYGGSYEGGDEEFGVTFGYVF